MAYHRLPKTANEKRFLIEDNEVKVRAKRKANALPDSWSDLRGLWNQKNWKRYRTKQYRMKEAA